MHGEPEQRTALSGRLGEEKTSKHSDTLKDWSGEEEVYYSNASKMVVPWRLDDLPALLLFHSLSFRKSDSKSSEMRELESLPHSCVS